MSPQHTLPVGLRVLALLKARVPRLDWDARLTLLVVADYEHIIDVEEVAQACAHFLETSTRAQDGPRTFRTMCAREKERRAPNVSPLRGRRDRYSAGSLRASPPSTPPRSGPSSPDAGTAS